MTENRAPQAIPEDTDDTPPPAAPAAEAPPPKRRGGRPKGSTNKPKAEKKEMQLVEGEVVVQLRIISKTEQGTYDFDREGHATGDLKQNTIKLITSWFNSWKESAALQ